MERKEAVKVETFFGSSMFPEYVQSNYPLQSVFDFSEGDKSSLGFMELLGMQDLGASSLFDVIQAPSSLVHSGKTPPNDPAVAAKVEESQEVLNQPATPNSSSISSASSEALNDEAPVKAEDNEEEEQQKTIKEVKPKKTNQKRQRAPRFAFMTKSEVDHLEDGYRWRKYGQKAVKNSPFPRSYYRCTSASCNVKKRVERCFNDPSFVVTTYEGQHTHHSPVMPRPSFFGAPDSAGFSSAAATSTPFSVPIERRLSLFQQPQQPAAFVNSAVSSTSSLGFGFNNINGTTANNVPSFLQEKRFCGATAASITGAESALLKDHGLLQDVVLSRMLKDD